MVSDTSLQTQVDRRKGVSSAPANLTLETYRASTVLTLIVPMISFVDTLGFSFLGYVWERFWGTHSVFVALLGLLVSGPSFLLCGSESRPSSPVSERN